MNNRFGVELEMEGVRSASLRRISESSLWEIASDGTLREYGVEFKFSGPLSHESAIDAINELYDNWAKAWSPTFRCGLHVHMDVGDMTEKEYITLQLYCMAIDEWLFKEFNSTHRMGGPFTRLLSGNPRILAGVKRNLIYILNGDEPLTNKQLAWGCDVQDNSWKYHATNFGALPRFGTVEFRHFAVPTERQVLFDIFDVLNSVKAAALDESCKIRSVNDFVMSEHELFLNLLPECADNLSAITAKLRLN